MKQHKLALEIQKENTQSGIRNHFHWINNSVVSSCSRKRCNLSTSSTSFIPNPTTKEKERNGLCRSQGRKLMQSINKEKETLFFHFTNPRRKKAAAPQQKPTFVRTREESSHDGSRGAGDGPKKAIPFRNLLVEEPINLLSRSLMGGKEPKDSQHESRGTQWLKGGR